MKRILNISIAVLAVIAAGVLAASILAEFQLLSSDADPRRFSLLPGIATSSGVLIAVLTFIRERGKAELERERHVSAVLLERASDGFRTVCELLSDQNNDRGVWIRAARTLLQSQRLGRDISSPEYKRAYQLVEERTRNDLYRLLTLPGKLSSGRQPLPPQFFYGIADWETCKSLDDAAVKVSQKVVAYQQSIDSVPPQPALAPLDRRSVVALFGFLEFPENYDDALADVSVWNGNWQSRHGVDQGAQRYVAHTQQKYAIDGKLHDRKKSPAQGEG